MGLVGLCLQCNPLCPNVLIITNACMLCFAVCRLCLSLACWTPQRLVRCRTPWRLQNVGWSCWVLCGEHQACWRCYGSFHSCAASPSQCWSSSSGQLLLLDSGAPPGLGLGGLLGKPAKATAQAAPEGWKGIAHQKAFCEACSCHWACCHPHAPHMCKVS
jgi:hypothetical protein